MGLYIIPLFINIFIFGWVLGVVTIGVVVCFGPAADILSFFILFLPLPFSAVYYPISIFPPLLQKLIFILPTRHMFEGMRTAIIEGVILLNSVFWVSAPNLICVLLGLLSFYWMFRLARIKGYLSRLVQD
jgi:ABC-2 type transport system permease protein